mgnify:CR=1 FL=1
MEKPNIFHYATSELSQDAIICWLAKWAHPKNRESDPELHKCGTSLIDLFFEKHGQTLPEIRTIKVSKQDQHIDVLIVVNDEFAIIVEDKTSTSDHGKQLENYLGEVSKRGYASDKVLPIYFKTHDQCRYNDVIEKGYQPFTPADFLGVLRPFSNHNNAILSDYRLNLEAHEDCVQSFRTLPIDKWEHWSWVGFYMALGQAIGTQDYKWRWVNNPSKSFWYFGWKWAGKAGFQLEEDKLTIKIFEEDPSKQKALRYHWHTIAIAVAQREGTNFEKPKRFGKGKHMTIAQLGSDYRKTKKEGFVDVEATAAGLRQLEPLLDLIVREAE